MKDFQQACVATVCDDSCCVVLALQAPIATATFEHDITFLALLSFRRRFEKCHMPGSAGVQVRSSRWMKPNVFKWLSNRTLEGLSQMPVNTGGAAAMAEHVHTLQASLRDVRQDLQRAQQNRARKVRKLEAGGLTAVQPNAVVASYLQTGLDSDLALGLAHQWSSRKLSEDWLDNLALLVCRSKPFKVSAQHKRAGEAVAAQKIIQLNSKGFAPKAREAFLLGHGAEALPKSQRGVRLWA